MAAPGQEFLDRALGVTSEDRMVLNHGRLPVSIRCRLHSVSRLNLVPLIAVPSLLIAVVTGIALRELWALVFPLLLGTVIVAGVRLKEILHQRSVFATRPMIRKIEGQVETHRTWEYGYGDMYHLWSSLNFTSSKDVDSNRGNHDAETVNLFEKLGNNVISGWVRVYVVTVPTLKRRLAPFYDELVAIETSEQTSVQMEPSKSPPTEPLRCNVPADE